MKLPSPRRLKARGADVLSHVARSGRSSSQPRPPARRSRAVFEQDGSRLVARCLIEAPDVARALWAHCEGTRFIIGSLEAGERDGRAVEYLAELDLEELAARVALIPREGPEPEASAGRRVTFYLEVDAPRGKMRRFGRLLSVAESAHAAALRPAGAAPRARPRHACTWTLWGATSGRTSPPSSPCRPFTAR